MTTKLLIVLTIVTAIIGISSTPLPANMCQVILMVMGDSPASILYMALVVSGVNVICIVVNALPEAAIFGMSRGMSMAPAPSPDWISPLYGGLSEGWPGAPLLPTMSSRAIIKKL